MNKHDLVATLPSPFERLSVEDTGALLAQIAEIDTDSEQMQTNVLLIQILHRLDELAPLMMWGDDDEK